MGPWLKAMCIIVEPEALRKREKQEWPFAEVSDSVLELVCEAAAHAQSAVPEISQIVLRAREITADRWIVLDRASDTPKNPARVGITADL